ncbi:MAG: AEC family transporter [Sporolactobacillus sp.]
MEFAVVLHQVIVMFLLMAVGFWAHKWHLIHDTGARDMTQILLYIVSPCVILEAFQQKFSAARLHDLLIAFIFIIFVFLMAILSAHFLFSNRFIASVTNRKTLKFAATYSNSGFMGIPLVSAILGPSGVFYATPYLAAFNIFCWTHGISLYRKNQDLKTQVKNIFNPNIVAILVGLIFFICSFRLPALLNTFVGDISSLNTPLSMIVIGDSIAAMPLLSLFSSRLIWPGVLMRNLIIPLETLVLFHFSGLGQVSALSAVLLSSCPIAGVIVLFALLNDSSTELPTQLMTVSTLLSIITIPLIASLALMW